MRFEIFATNNKENVDKKNQEIIRPKELTETKEISALLTLSMASFLLQRTLHPPTGVDHCLESYFFSSLEKNLLIVQATELVVFSVVQVRRRGCMGLNATFYYPASHLS